MDSTQNVFMFFTHTRWKLLLSYVLAVEMLDTMASKKKLFARR